MCANVVLPTHQSQIYWINSTVYMFYGIGRFESRYCAPMHLRHQSTSSMLSRNVIFFFFRNFEQFLSRCWELARRIGFGSNFPSLWVMKPSSWWTHFLIPFGSNWWSLSKEAFSTVTPIYPLATPDTAFRDTWTHEAWTTFFKLHLFKLTRK